MKFIVEGTLPAMRRLRKTIRLDEHEEKQPTKTDCAATFFIIVGFSARESTVLWLSWGDKER